MSRARSKSKKSKSKSKSSKRKGGQGARAKAVQAAKRRMLEEQALEAEAQRKLEELFSDTAPVERSAEVFLERLEAGPAPAGITRFFLVASSAERARAVVAEVQRHAPGSATALTLAADVAFVLDGDVDQASALLGRALELLGDDGDRVTLANHYLEIGAAAQALELVEPVLREAPEDADAEAIRAGALWLAHARREGDLAPGLCPCCSGREWERCCARAERAALERFGDRGALEGVGAALDAFIAGEPYLAQRVARDVEAWMEQDEGEEDAELAGLLTMAVEHAWLVGDEDDGEEPDDPLDGNAPLALFARDPATPPPHAAAARRWLSHCRYGLWQVADPVPAPGVWVTEITTGERRYAALAGDHLAAAGRWSVLLGALVAVDGTWRSAGALLALAPSEADAAADTLEAMASELGAALTGGRNARRAPRSGPPPPYGVLVAGEEPESAEVRDLASMIAGSVLPMLVADVLERRKAGPRLCNTDGDELCVIRAHVGVDDAAATARELAAHPDVEDDDGVLAWWGRPLDTLERETMLAQVRSQYGEVPEEDGPQRWLRGRIHPADGGFEVEVNSRERFERLLDLLRGLGEEPRISRKLVFDPAEDLPQLRRDTLFPFAGSPASHAAWCEHWPDSPLPALGGRTPRRAARREADQPLLEALLREFEHDADLMARRGLDAPDIAGLRRELQMPVEAWLG